MVFGKSKANNLILNETIMNGFSLGFILCTKIVRYVSITTPEREPYQAKHSFCGKYYLTNSTKIIKRIKTRVSKL